MQTPLGSNLYLFHAAKDVFANECVISSHGGFGEGCWGNSVVVPNGVSLQFYCDHGASVTDLGLRNFLSTALHERASHGGKHRYKGGATCPNYSLSKYQNSEKAPTLLNKHAAKHNRFRETYSSISSYVTANDDLSRKVDSLNAFVTAFNQRGSSQSELIQRGSESSRLLAMEEGEADRAVEAEYDVVTVRDRTFGFTVNLGDVLTELGKVHAYSVVHCYFCRSVV